MAVIENIMANIITLRNLLIKLKSLFSLACINLITTNKIGVKIATRKYIITYVK
jgi:hypothetical protein